MMFFNMFYIYGNCMISNFLMASQNFLKLPKKIFFFWFFNRKLNFVLKQPLKKKLHAKFNFCVPNVVLDALMLDLFTFRLLTFFKNARKFPFLLHGMLMYVLINV